MKGSKISLVVLIFLIVFPISAQTNSWRGLVPLRSTRADVEKVLGGTGSDEFRGWKYETTDASVYVGYTTGNCDDGWDVPKDRVLTITVYDASTGNSIISAKEMGLDRERFAVLVDDAFFGKWVDAENGIYYYFLNLGQAFISKTYFPKGSDNELRCNGFPPYAPDAEYAPYDYLPFLRPSVSARENDQLLGARVDASMMQSRMQSREGDWIVYVMVYFDGSRSIGFYRSILERLRNHAFKKRGYSRDRLFFIEGGMREESQIEFYILAPKMKPPAPRPTLPSPQFMHSVKKSAR